MRRLRKRLTIRQRSSLEYKQRAPLSIGETRHEKQDREDAEETQQIVKTRMTVFNTRPVCQVCKGARRAECFGRPDEMHEDPSRAQTRGLPPDQRFNTQICGRLCHACHADVTNERIRLVFADRAAGFTGKVAAVRC